jgi:UDPglucose 6-dehydrogenase
MRITVVGSGYVGLVAGACLAEIGHDVFLVDKDLDKYSALMRGECPIHEQYLPELLDRHRGRRLTFSHKLAEAAAAGEAIIIAVGTPPTAHGEADLSHVESVAREIASSITSYKVVIGKSTVPVYTNDWVRRVLLLNGAREELVDVVSNPEFLREGVAVTDFLFPDRIVVGVNSPRAAAVLREIYRPLVDGSYYQREDRFPLPPSEVRQAKLIITTAKSAELIKYASNAFLAMKISFINAVATICDFVGADIDEVREGIGSDGRIGHKFLSPGIGYGGSCFPKDLSAYRAVARECGYDFRLLEEVMEINDQQRERFLRKVQNALWTLKGKRLGVLGLAFKGGTDDVRESPAVAITASLIQKGASVCVYDPAAAPKGREVLSSDRIRYVNSVYEAAEGADALLILTDWDEFRQVDYSLVRDLLRYPIVIDGRNLLSPELMRSLGIMYFSMGRPDVRPPSMAGSALVRTNAFEASPEPVATFLPSDTAAEGVLSVDPSR